MIKKIIYLAFLLPLAGNAQTTVIIAILSASSYNLPFKIKYIYLLSFCDKLQ